MYSTDLIDKAYEAVASRPDSAREVIAELQRLIGSQPEWETMQSGLCIDFGTSARDEDLIKVGLSSEIKFIQRTPPQSLGSRFYNIANAFSSLGYLERKFKRYEPDTSSYLEAKAYYQKAISHSNGSPEPEVLINFANCLDGMGRPLEACEMWNRALKLSPDHPMAQGNLGQGLEYLARMTHDAHLYPEAREALSRALSCPKMENPSARKPFSETLARVNRFIDRYGPFDHESDRTDRSTYQKWCQENNLLLGMARACFINRFGLKLVTSG